MVKKIMLYSTALFGINGMLSVHLLNARDNQEQGAIILDAHVLENNDIDEQTTRGGDQATKIDFWTDTRTKGIMGMMDSMLQINPTILARLQKTGVLIREKRKVVNVRGVSVEKSTIQEHCVAILAPIKGFFDEISNYKESLRPLVLKSIVENGEVLEHESMLLHYINSKESLSQFCDRHVTTRQEFLNTCDELEKLFGDLLKNVSEKTMSTYKKWVKMQSDQAARREKKKAA